MLLNCSSSTFDPKNRMPIAILNMMKGGHLFTDNTHGSFRNPPKARCAAIGALGHNHLYTILLGEN